MKAHPPRPRRRASQRAARTHLQARLGWLRGFPRGEGWCSLGARGRGRGVSLDRECVRAGRFAVGALLRRFPRALPEVVGDLGAWKTNTERHLEWIRSRVQEGSHWPADAALVAGLPRRRQPGAARWLSHAHVGDLARALVWLALWDRETQSLARGLERLEAWRTWVAQLVARSPNEGFDLALCALLAPDAQPFEGVLRALGQAESWKIPQHHAGLAATLKRKLKGRNGARDWQVYDPPRPVPHRAARLLSAALDALSHPPREALRLLKLLGALNPSAHTEAWGAWWAGLAPLERRTRRLLAQRTWTHFHRLQVAELSQELSAHESEAPAPAGGLPNLALKHLARDREGFEFVRELLGCDEGDMNTRLLEAWDLELRPLPTSRRRCAYACVRELVQRAGPAVLPQVVKHLLSYLSDALEQGAEGHFPQSQARPLGRALAEHAQRVGSLPKTRPQFDLLRLALAASGDAAWASALVGGLGEAAGRLGPEGARALVALARETSGQASALAEVVGDWEAAECEGLRRLMARPCGPSCLGPLLLRSPRRVRSLCQAASVLGDAAQSLPPFAAGDATPAWISTYPHALREALGVLAATSPTAEEAAERVLRRALPRQANLERELAAIEERLPNQPSLCPRRDSLRARIDSPRPLSQARLTRLAHKLLERARLAWLDNAQAALQGALTRRRRELAVLTECGHADLAPHLALLPGSFAQPLRQLLAARRGPQPWDLRDEPANSAFVGGLLERGIDPVPWLEGFGVQVVGEEGWELSLEDDPLWILRMGEPFATCLAPGSFNFFSALSNALDLNKRVLYARDSGGKIVGRMLLAITSEWRLRTFRPYALDPGGGFAELALDCARALARRMGTTHDYAGVIPRLVAPRWYEDGEWRLGEVAGEPTWEGIKELVSPALTLAPANRVARLRRRNRLGEGPLPRALGWHLLELEEVKASRTLLLALRHELPRDRSLLAQLARCLVDVGCTDAARDLARVLARVRSNPGECPCCVAHAAASLLLDVGLPSLTLRTLRRSRPRAIRSAHQEEEPRVRLHARALWALHRPRQALELLKASGHPSLEGLREELRAVL
jgi:hypothetical protein